MVPPGCGEILWRSRDRGCVIVMKDLVEQNHVNGLWKMSVGMGIPTNDNSLMYYFNISLHTIPMQLLHVRAIWDVLYESSLFTCDEILIKLI